MADLKVTKNPDGSLHLVVSKVVTQETNEDFNFGSVEELNAKVAEIANAETPAA